MSSSKKVTVGYKYSLGIHMIVCHGPIDSLDRIDVDNKPVWTGSSTGGNITVDAPNHFGGEDREGGVQGTVTLEMGGPSQPKNSYLMARLGANIPAYRGVVGMVLNQVYIGMSPYLRAWSFWATRIMTKSDGTAQWYSTKANVAGDMNPAHIIRECLTDPKWGMGYPENDIDDVSFTYAADYMHSEGMGLSLVWDRSTTLEDFLQEILKHIQGSIYVSRESGKFVLKLARDDYDLEDLLVLDEDSVSKITDYKKSLIGELYNSVSVVFWDASTGKNNSVTLQDIALAGQQQATIGTTKQFPGITKSDLAARVAARELKAMSTPMASATIYTNRKASGLNVGDVFRLQWPRLGLADIVMRVVSLELGSLESNQVKITCVEDLFSLSSSSYIVPPSGDWEDPIGDPVPSTQHFLFEAPYWEMAQRIGDAAAAALPVTSSFFMVTARPPAVFSDNARISVSRDGGTTWVDSGLMDYCPTATLGSNIGRTETSLPISGISSIVNVVLGTYLVIDSEVMSVKAITDTVVTVGRGCLDTVPVPHAVNSPIGFVDDFTETDNVEYALGEIPRVRVLPVSGNGTLPLVSAPVLSVTMMGRHSRPYPPQKFQLEGMAYPASVAGDIDLSFTWVSRNRLTQTSSLVDTEASTITAEAGTTYTLEIRTSGGTLIIAKTGLSSLSQVITLAELGSNYGNTRALLWSVRDGLDSWQKHDFTFERIAP